MIPYFVHESTVRIFQSSIVLKRELVFESRMVTICIATGGHEATIEARYAGTRHTAFTGWATGNADESCLVIDGTRPYDITATAPINGAMLTLGQNVRPGDFAIGSRGYPRLNF